MLTVPIFISNQPYWMLADIVQKLGLQIGYTKLIRVDPQILPFLDFFLATAGGPVVSVLADCASCVGPLAPSNRFNLNTPLSHNQFSVVAVVCSCWKVIR